MEEIPGLVQALDLDFYMCYENESGIKLTILKTVKPRRSAWISKVIDHLNQTKTSDDHMIVLQNIGDDSLITGFTKNIGNRIEDSAIYIGVRQAKVEGNPSYHAWFNNFQQARSSTKKTSGMYWAVMLHQSGEGNERDGTASQDDGIEESEVPFGLEDSVENEEDREEGVDAPNVEGINEGAIDTRVENDKDRELRRLKKRVLELETRASALDSVIKKQNQLLKDKDVQIKDKDDQIQVMDDRIEKQLDMLKEKDQIINHFKEKYEHYEHMSFQLRGRLGFEQREVNRPVREENQRLISENDLLQERVDVIHETRQLVGSTDRRTKSTHRNVLKLVKECKK